MGNSLKYLFLSFCHKNIFQKEKNDQNSIFHFGKFNLFFYFLKFETLSPKLHPLTLNSKSRLINFLV